ncbi:MAG: hypothetical protein HZC36_15415 [Armatimonadetes bacterium]|nr:hypothetical protein [Armatimonadota bacterium]
MKYVPLLIGIALSSSAAADRFIHGPIAQKLPYGALKLEGLWSGAEGRTASQRVGLGFATVFDGELVWDRRPGHESQFTFDLAYNYTDPVVTLIPGVSIGVQDALNRSEAGRRFYWVTTYHYGLDGKLNQNVPLEFTLGASLGARNGAIASFNIPFANWIRLVSEYDAGRLTQGLEYRPSKEAVVRMLFEEKTVLWTASLVRRF